MVDAFRRSSAARITAVIPYYGYARQDRKDKPRVPISAKLVANLLSAAGTNRVLTMDLHKAQIQGFFDIPVDHLFAAPVIIEYLSRLNYPKLTIVSPDAGGAERARAYAKRLDAELAIIDKRRTRGWHGGGDERHRRRRGTHLHSPGRHHRHRGNDSEGGERAEGGGRGARARVRGARRAVGPGDRPHRELAARSADRDEHDSAAGATRSSARRSWCCRWRGCWARRSGAFTRRRRSLRCLCRTLDYGLRSVRSGRRHADGDRLRPRQKGTIDVWTRHSKREAGRQGEERGAGACAPRAGFRPSSTARARTDRRPKACRWRSTRRRCSASCTPTPARTR